MTIRTVHVSLLATAAVAALTVVLHTGGPVRLASVFVAVCLLPGAAILTTAKVDDPLAWLGLAVVLSFAVGTLACCLMLVAGWWHPKALGAVALVSCGAIAIDLARAARPGHGAGAGPGDPAPAQQNGTGDPDGSPATSTSA